MKNFVVVGPTPTTLIFIFIINFSQRFLNVFQVNKSYFVCVSFFSPFNLFVPENLYFFEVLKPKQK